MNRRMTILVAAAGAMLAIVAVWSHQFMVSQQENADAARADLSDCLGMMDQIESISSNPIMVAEHERRAAETTGMIERAAQAAGVDLAPAAGHHMHIMHQSPYRLGETVYKVKPTQVMLQSMPMKQVVDMLLDLARQDAGLNVDSIRLDAPREAGPANQWSVEFVLSYLIHEPQQAGNIVSPLK